MTSETDGLRWTIHGRKTLYTSRWVQLSLADVEAPNGERFDHHVVALDRVAIAFIVNSAEEALTLWRYRFAVDSWGYELLGGLVEDGEDSAATAAREAEEESGWRPVGKPTRLISFQPLPGMVDSPIDVFLWREAKKVGEPTDGEEAARIEWVPVDRLFELAQRGELLGAGSIVPLLMYLASRR